MMESKVQSPALFVRILKYSFVVSGFLFIYVAVKVPVPAHVPVSMAVEIAITLAGLGCVLGGFLLPRYVFKAAERKPGADAPEALLKRWTAKGILSLAYFEACVLFGLVLHFLEARNWLVGLLFGAGIAAELVWSPGKPPGGDDAKPAQD